MWIKSFLKKMVPYNLVWQTTIYLINKSSPLAVFIGRIFEILSKRNFLLLKVDFFSSLDKTIVEKQKDVCVYLPATINNPSQPVSKIQFPLGYLSVENALVSSDSPLVIVGNQILKQKFSKTINDKDINYQSSHIIANSGTHYLHRNPANKVTLERGIFFCGSWPYNWYHFIVEICSKYAIYMKLEEELQSYPIILPNKLESSKNHMAHIKRLFPENELIFLDRNEVYEVKKMIWIDSSVISAPKIRNDREQFALDSNFDFGLMKEYKNFITKDLTKTESFRLFLMRKQETRSYNQQEIAAALKKYNFTPLYCEDLNYDEQRFYFYNADVIIGPTGASWANLLFANDHCKGLIWMPEMVSKRTTFSNLAKLANCDLIHHYFPTDFETWVEFKNDEKPYQLDISAIENVLAKWNLNN